MAYHQFQPNTSEETIRPRTLQVANPSPPSPVLPAKRYLDLPIPGLNPLPPAGLTRHEEINWFLMQAHILIECRQNYLTALNYSTIAVNLSTKHNYSKLEAKGQALRTRSLIEYQQWDDARWALVRAASVRGYFREEIEGLRKRLDDEEEKTEKQMAQLREYHESVRKDREEFEKRRVKY